MSSSSSSSEPWGSKKSNREKGLLEKSIRRKLREQRKGVAPRNYEYRPQKERSAAEIIILVKI